MLSHLGPYLSVRPGHPFIVDIQADVGHDIQLKLSDSSIIQLPLQLNMAEALACLAAAKQWEGGGGAAAACSNNDTNINSLATAVDQGTANGYTCHGGKPLGNDVITEAAEVLNITTTTTSSSSSSSSVSLASAAVKTLFGSDNRTGVSGTLHRISAMRDKQGAVIGLTYRIGRHVPGVAMVIGDVLSSMKASIRGSAADRPQSLLLLGRPGVGKTTLLRDIARLMSLPASQGGFGLAVVIVDTSNEIAGKTAGIHGPRGAAAH